MCELQSTEKRVGMIGHGACHSQMPVYLHGCSHVQWPSCDRPIWTHTHTHTHTDTTVTHSPHVSVWRARLPNLLKAFFSFFFFCFCIFLFPMRRVCAFFFYHFLFVFVRVESRTIGRRRPTAPRRQRAVDRPLIGRSPGPITDSVIGRSSGTAAPEAARSPPTAAFDSLHRIVLNSESKWGIYIYIFFFS